MDTTDHLFKGVFTALITPFRNSEVDYDSLKNLIDHQINGGIHGIVLMGTTGECATLEDEERHQILKTAIAHINGRVPILIGTGSNCTKKSIQLSHEAEALGADGLLIVAPYYNKPTQEGLYLHYEAIAKATKKPICLYSIPSRCGVEIATDTVARLRNTYKNILAIKEAGGSCNRVSQLIKDNDRDFCVLCGDDALALPFFALGAKGVISAAANWITKPMVEMLQLSSNNDLESASNINRQYYPLFRALTIETNPVPIKYFLFKAGLIKSPEVRLPLCSLSDNSLTLVQNVFESLHGLM
jgi:4-hydroxy-tetrahydrodipicolinate synthase